MRKLREIIREERRAQELTQQEVGEMIGSNKNVISMFEKGKHGLRSDSVDILLDKLDLEVVSKQK